MIALIDIGNTTIGFALKNKKIELLKVVDTKDLKNHKNIDEVIKGVYQNVDACVISSVVPSLNDLFKAYFIKEFRIEPLFISVELNHKYQIDLDNPHELGADLLSVIFGSSLYFKESIIVDLGTASKFLAVKGDVFIGGAIAPGFEGSFNSLFSNAELLNEFKLKDTFHALGHNTNDCIASGVILGHTSCVDGMIQRIKEETNIQNIILTGGCSKYIIDHLKSEYLYVPNLIFEGMLLIYETRR